VTIASAVIAEAFTLTALRFQTANADGVVSLIRYAVAIVVGIVVIQRRANFSAAMMTGVETELAHWTVLAIMTLELVCRLSCGFAAVVVVRVIPLCTLSTRWQVVLKLVIISVDYHLYAAALTSPQNLVRRPLPLRPIVAVLIGVEAFDWVLIAILKVAGSLRLERLIR
jgi:hypothetical protein